VNSIHLLALLRQRLLGLRGLCAEICCICDVRLLLCLLQVVLRPRIQLAAWLLLLLWLSVVVLGAWNVKVIVIVVVITTVIIVTPNIIVICARIIPVIASSAHASTTHISMLLSTICSVACSLLLLLLTSAVLSIWRMLLLLAVVLLPLQLAAATTDGLTTRLIVQLQLQRTRHAAVTACGALPC
jgi:hypothetical protein